MQICDTHTHLNVEKFAGKNKKSSAAQEMGVVA